MTANDVFEIAMSLIDERLASGIVDATSTAIFKKNTPYILTSLQNELIRTSEYYKTHTITKSLTTNTAGYQEYTMPSDFYNAYQIIQIDTTRDNASDFRWEEQNKLYVPDEFVGTIKIVYYPIPEAITALTDPMVLDSITCSTTLANGLASRLLTNENRALANYFNGIYNDLKNQMKIKRPAFSEPIKEMYDMSY